MTKTCSDCKEDRPLGEFYAHPESRDGKMAHCKACARSRTKKWRADNPLKTKLQAGRARKKMADAGLYFFTRYGITKEQKFQIFEKQGKVCAICRSTESGSNRTPDAPSSHPEIDGWHLDHDHTTLVIRGVLCLRCNLMLGYARDSAETLSSGIRYLSSGVGFGVVKK